MSSSKCFNIFRIAVCAVAILDLILNIFFLISSYIAKRDGTYNAYEYEWYAFYVIRLAIASMILYGVIRMRNALLVISCVLNGLVFAVVVYAVAVGKFKYRNCERELCISIDSNCETCYARNYADYHLTTKWACEFLLWLFFFISWACKDFYAFCFVLHSF